MATGLGIGTISTNSDVVRFVQGGVVKTFRYAAYARLKSDPYRSPAVTPDDNVVPSVPERGSRFIRFTLYAHLSVVVLTAIALAHDSATWVWSDWWEPILKVLLMIGLLGFIACPILLIVAVLRSSLSPARRLVVLCVGGAIAFAHFVALLPGVQ